MQWTPHFYEVVTVATCNEYLLLKTTKEKQEQRRQVQTGAPVFQGHLCTAPTAISYRWRHLANHAWGSSACHTAFFLGYRGIVHPPSEEGTERTWFEPEQRPRKRVPKRSVDGKQGRTCRSSSYTVTYMCHDMTDLVIMAGRVTLLTPCQLPRCIFPAMALTWSHLQFL